MSFSVSAVKPPHSDVSPYVGRYDDLFSSSENGDTDRYLAERGRGDYVVYRSCADDSNDGIRQGPVDVAAGHVFPPFAVRGQKRLPAMIGTQKQKKCKVMTVMKKPAAAKARPQRKSSTNSVMKKPSSKKKPAAAGPPRIKKIQKKPAADPCDIALELAKLSQFEEKEDSFVRRHYLWR